MLPGHKLTRDWKKTGSGGRPLSDLPGKRRQRMPWVGSSGHSAGSSEGEGTALRDGFPTPPGIPPTLQSESGEQTDTEQSWHQKSTPGALNPFSPKPSPSQHHANGDSGRKRRLCIHQTASKPSFETEEHFPPNSNSVLTTGHPPTGEPREVSKSQICCLY